MREFAGGQLNKGVLEPATRFISQHSTALIHNGDVIGSGTFARIGERRGILTAYHVPHNTLSPFDFAPNSGDRLGVGLESIAHAFWMEMQYVVPHEIGVPESDEFGPDLMFLELPPSSQLETIRAKRSFWNLSYDAEKRTQECYSDLNCLWAIAGHPHVWRKEEIPTHGFSPVLGFPNLIGYTGVESRFQRHGFDYFEVAADYRSKDSIPQTFGGVSGGGLWRIPIRLENESDPLDMLQTGDPVLAGVVFYQTALEAHRRILRSHGAKSIYQVLTLKLTDSQNTVQ